MKTIDDLAEWMKWKRYSRYLKGGRVIVWKAGNRTMIGLNGTLTPAGAVAVLDSTPLVVERIVERIGFGELRYLVTPIGWERSGRSYSNFCDAVLDAALQWLEEQE